MEFLVNSVPGILGLLVSMSFCWLGLSILLGEECK